MSFVKVYIHYVWGTKNREPLLASKELRQLVWQHMRENAREKGIYIDYINGHKDHCHCLVSLGLDQSIQKVAQLLKGESSYWINQQKLTPSKFEWQQEYFAVSVSESMVAKVREYIRRQDEHHATKSFEEETTEFMAKYGFVRKDDF
ncbi:IS200/IS605 family transposase [Rufibacter sp. LB8]|uniref:IS200/IS605 family transposase n=1 Tax=Rufibacter sp. LB8 TaxID=2777781 RepID=UPI00178C331F|nr:IS200/IS605 family transposase [Rufibacter sp. LB8]